MSEPCSIEMCKSASRTQCHCCKKNFCRNHFIEHDNLPDFQLNSLADEINLLNDRLIVFNVERLIGDSRQKLEEWRIRCHKLIDDVFEARCQEISQRAKKKIDQQRDEIHQVRSTVTQLLQTQETTMKDIDLLKTTINTIEEKIKAMEQICFEVTVRPLVIDDTSIHIDEIYQPQLNLSPLPSSYKNINHLDGSFQVIGSNNQLFLIHQNPDLCLMNRELAVVNKCQWNYGEILDMCWSPKLARFFVITETNVFTVNASTMAVEFVHIGRNQKWYSCTSSDTKLYLSTFYYGSSILQFHLFPSIKIEKEWTSPDTCAERQLITSIVYNNATIAMTLLDRSKEEKLIELRLATTLNRLWSLKLDVEYSPRFFRCCLLSHGHWLVSDCNALRLLHINKDGKLQATSQCNENPIYVILFNADRLAISTLQGINLYRVKC